MLKSPAFAAVAGLLSVLVTALPSRAADLAATPSQPAPAATPWYSWEHWGFEVEGLVLTSPKYEGSNQYRVLGFPVVIPKYYGSDYNPNERPRFTFRDVDDIRYALIRYGNLDVGPLAGYTFGRDESDSDRLKGLGDVDGGLVLGGFAAYHFDPFYVDAAIGSQVTGDADGAYTVKLGVGADFKVTPRLTLSPYLSTTYASAGYMENYFSITPAQSLRSRARLSAFDADAGFKDVSFNFGADFRLTKRWSASTTLGYSRLIGDAADSPVTADPNQFSAMVGVSYTFGRTD